MLEIEVWGGIESFLGENLIRKVNEKGGIGGMTVIMVGVFSRAPNGLVCDVHDEMHLEVLAGSDSSCSWSFVV